jgi:hypothetical protein
MAATAGALFAAWVNWHGFTLYWGDAEAHLNIARRIVESRNPGYSQMGSPWLPLPHLLMLPFVLRDSLWQTGLAGAIPNVLCFTAAAVFLFASMRRVLSQAAAWCAMSLLVLNPNALYVQSIPMTEAVFFAALLGLLFFTTRYHDTQTMSDLVGAGLMADAAAMTRYEGWILIPFAALYILITSQRQRIVRVLLFGVLASLGAAWWLFYNWGLSGNALDFYNGPNSAMAIQLGLPYPGHGNWRVAIQYFVTAVKLVNGWPLVWIGGIGAAAAIWRGAVWPIVLLALWPLFIVWSMHSSAQPIHIPPLPPHSYYNTRYALSALPVLAAGAGALATFRNVKGMVLPIAVVLLAAGYWGFHADHENWLTWKESEQNSVSRRPWTHAAAAYLVEHTKPTDTFFSTFGDISGVFREAGIPFRRTLTWDDFPEWQAAVNRPDLFLWEDWAVAQCGDPVDRTVLRAGEVGVHYDLAVEINVPGGEPIEIYRRHEYPLR